MERTHILKKVISLIFIGLLFQGCSPAVFFSPIRKDSKKSPAQPGPSEQTQVYPPQGQPPILVPDLSNPNPVRESEIDSAQPGDPNVVDHVRVIDVTVEDNKDKEADVRPIPGPLVPQVPVTTQPAIQVNPPAYMPPPPKRVTVPQPITPPTSSTTQINPPTYNHPTHLPPTPTRVVVAQPVAPKHERTEVVTYPVAPPPRIDVTRGEKKQTSVIPVTTPVAVAPIPKRKEAPVKQNLPAPQKVDLGTTNKIKVAPTAPTQVKVENQRSPEVVQAVTPQKTKSVESLVWTNGKGEYQRLLVETTVPQANISKTVYLQDTLSSDLSNAHGASNQDFYYSTKFLLDSANKTVIYTLAYFSKLVNRLNYYTYPENGTLNKYPKLAKETLKDSEVIKGTVINSDIIKQLMASEECDVESNGPCILIQQNGKKAYVVGTLKYRADYCYVYLDAKCVANEMPLSTATYNGRFEEGDTQFLYAPINRGNAEIDSAANVLFAVENQGTVLFSQKNR